MTNLPFTKPFHPLFLRWVQLSIGLLIAIRLFLISVSVQAQTCTLTLKPTVSGCYQNNGSKSTVSVEVGWANATVSPTANDASDAITVTFAGQTKTINPGAYTSSGGNGTIVSPQVVAFEVTADASSQTAQAFIGADYASSTCKIEQTGIVLPAACPPTVCASGQTGGTVWNDFNADGIKQSGEISGVLGVTVKAYDCNGTLVSTTTTDVFGQYAFTGISAGSYPIRVEFSNLPAYAGQGTVNGTDGRTTVQFITAADCNVDLGILDPTDYCQSTPKIYIPCYVAGDPIAGSASGNGDALVSFTYGTTGLKDMSKISVIATADKIGTLWGMAYSKQTKKLYGTATIKRHAGLGPQGIGGLYTIDVATNTVTGMDLASLGINVGSIASNAARGLVSDPNQPSADAQAFTAIGKEGLGDVDISADGSFLYVVSLNDKKLNKLNVTGASPTLAGSYTIPTPSCVGGEWRPFATKVYKGKVYVGGVCDAQTSDNKSNLQAYVYAFDESSSSFNSTPIFDFPLTYPKGFPQSDYADRTGWHPWSDDFDRMVINSPYNSTDRSLIYPQPIFSDIEFDVDGSMILGFADRAGIQSGVRNADLAGSMSPRWTSGYSGGDVLRATFTGSAYILENNAKAGASVGYGPTNNQGPGFGEFYNDDWFYGTALVHSEAAFGGLALRPGSGEVIVTCMDPINYPNTGENFDLYGNSGGIRYLNNTSGLSNAAFVLYNTFVPATNAGTFGKATGLGDIEVGCDLPTYLEIGNRVWNDVNKNGVQDPCEKALKDVNVTLYKGATKIATAKTDVNGEYYFSSKSKIGSGTWLGTGADTSLLATTAYKLVFGEGQLSGGKLTIASLGQFDITLKDATANNGNDQNDSDAELLVGAFCINLTTGVSGSVNHTLDAGFYCSNPAIGNKITTIAPTCTGTTANNNGKVTLTAAVTPYDKFRVKTGTGAWTGDTTYATATTIGTTFPVDLKTSVPNAGATYVIRFYIGECCYKDTTIIVTLVNCACTQPTIGTPTSIVGTCTSGTPNNNATASVTVAGGDKADIVEGASYGSGPAYNAATNVSVTAGVAGFTGLKHATQYTIRVWNADNTCFRDVTFTTLSINCCIKPVAVATPKKQTICVGSTASVFTATPSTGVEYKWYGPLADTTSILGTAIASQTTATYTPTGVALTTAGTKYYAVVVNTTGDVTCADTAFVQLIVNAKPTIADGTATICEGESVDLTSKITDYATLLSPVWTVSTAGGTAVTTPTVVKPSATTTYILVAQNAAGCKDTAQVVVTVNPKPNAGTDKTLPCADPVAGTLQTTTTLTGFSPAGGAWAAQTGNPAVASVTNAGAVSGMSVAGTYQFIYTLAGCSDTIAVTVEPCAGCVKPNAGPDQNICAPTTTATLTGFSPAGGTWAAQTGNPANATVSNAGAVTGMTANGTYKFIYSITQGGQTCTDTVQIVRNPKPVVGDATICSPATTASVTRTPAGGTWIADPANPAPASISAAGAISGLTADGTYKFVYTLNGCSDTATVVRNPKPNAGTDKTLPCADPIAGTLQTTTTLTGFSPAGGAWAAQTGNPAAASVTNAGAVSGMSVAGTYQFIYTVSGCSDTVAVTVEPCAGCVKPNAGTDQNICAPTSSATLNGFSPAGGTWTPQTGNPANATVNNAGAVTGLTANGTYKFIYAITQGGQTCTDTVQIIRNPKPVVGDATICSPATTASVTRTPAGGTWIADPANPAPASISAAGAISGLTADGTYKFVYTLNGCSDTATVVRNPKPNAGTDKTLPCADPIAGTLQTTTTLTGFSPAGGTWAAQTGNPAAASVTNAGAVSGMSVAGTYQFIYTVSGCSDTVAVTVEPCAGCVKPNAGPDQTLLCSAGVAPSTTTLIASPTGGIWTAQTGNPVTASVTNAGAVTGMTTPGVYKFIYSVTAGGQTCQDTVAVIVPNCNCNPSLPVLSTPSLTVCIGDTFPTLKATVVGLATVEWFTQATGGVPVFTGLNYKPSGTVPTTGAIFYAQARSTDPTCPTAISSMRVMATINAQDCTKEVDLALKKAISTKIAQIGDVLTYSLKVWNQSTTNATGVEVTDSIATTVQFQVGSFAANRGTATISGNVIKWSIGNIAANGDTVTLTYQVKATQEGVHFNTAEICKTNEKDVDSTPCNNKDDEDDIDRQCFTVPFKLCAGSKVEASVNPKYTNVQWFKDGAATPIASGNVVLLSGVGVYTYTAANQTCPVGGCCPIIIENSNNCCPVEACVPFTIRKIKK